MNRPRTVVAGLIAAVSLVAVSALVFGVNTGDGQPPAGALQLAGRAVLLVDDEPRRTLETGRHQLSTGDRVQLVEGFGVLALGGGASLELREGRGVAADSEAEVGEPAVLRAGDALLRAPTAARVVIAGTEVGLAGGAARLARTSGASVGVYEGLVGLSSGGRTLPGGVPALRQVTVATLGAVPARAEPLDYDPDAPDPWDRRYIGRAIELGEALEARSVGFTASLADGEGIDADFLADALPSLAAEPAFADNLIDDGRAAGDLLVGAAIAVAGDEGGFRERWRSTFAFRGDGARWGIVALDQGVLDLSLLDTVDAAIGGAPLLFGPEALALAGLPAGGALRTGPAVGGGDPGSPVPPPSPPPPSPPPPEPPPEPPGPLDPVTDPLPPPVADPLDPILEPLEPALEPLAPILQPLEPVIDPLAELLGDILGADEDGVAEADDEGATSLVP
ncbi:MAG: hypothetical protein WD232_01020 [Acidimicrobiales bacterium]